MFFRIRSSWLTLIFCGSIIAIGVIAGSAIITLTLTFKKQVNQVKINLDAAATARITTMGMEQSLYHLLAARNVSERREAAISAIKASSYFEESLQKLSERLPGNDKVILLNQLNNELNPIRMRIITNGIHGQESDALNLLHSISPITSKFGILSQAILTDVQQELLKLANDNIDHGLQTIWVLEVMIAITLVSVLSLSAYNIRLHAEQQSYIDRLTIANKELETAQGQLFQSEKLASIGQLAAGVAHEINNPIGFVLSNFITLDDYLKKMFDLTHDYMTSENYISDVTIKEALVNKRKKIEFDFIREDALVLMNESRDGIERVCKIVKNLTDFSHNGIDNDWQRVDILLGLETTLNLINHEIKYNAEVIREFTPLPAVQCIPSELNQVFMNILVNAAHSMENKQQGKIILRTGYDQERIWLEIADTGSGIPQQELGRIFDPFFTTKPVGKGTGLGLSISYGIVQKHHGSIEVHSELDKGTCFRILLPINQPEQ